jgi:hypothetical protein
MDRISGVARPGSKGVARKNHKARLISWTGRAMEMRNGKKEPRNSEFHIPDSEFGTPDGPASSCGSTGGSPGQILFPPMLFPRNALVSGPQVCFSAGKRIAKANGSKPIID